jgi:hypothetical protein
MRVELPDNEFKPRLLYNRESAAHLLDVSVSQVRALEREGKLTSLTMTGKATGAKFFTHDELIALVEDMKEQAQRRKATKKKSGGVERRRLEARP